MKLVIYCDTREKLPYQFKNTVIKRKTLKAGDYSCKGGLKTIRIERKSIADLYATITRKDNRIRFEKELVKLKKIGMWYLIVDGTIQQVLNGYKYSQANGYAVLLLVFELVHKYNGRVLFCGNRTESALVVHSIFSSLGYDK